MKLAHGYTAIKIFIELDFNDSSERTANELRH